MRSDRRRVTRAFPQATMIFYVIFAGYIARDISIALFTFLLNDDPFPAFAPSSRRRVSERSKDLSAEDVAQIERRLPKVNAM